MSKQLEQRYENEEFQIRPIGCVFSASHIGQESVIFSCIKDCTPEFEVCELCFSENWHHIPARKKFLKKARI